MSHTVQVQFTGQQYIEDLPYLLGPSHAFYVANIHPGVTWESRFRETFNGAYAAGYNTVVSYVVVPNNASESGVALSGFDYHLIEIVNARIANFVGVNVHIGEAVGTTSANYAFINVGNPPTVISGIVYNVYPTVPVTRLTSGIVAS